MNHRKIILAGGALLAVALAIYFFAADKPPVEIATETSAPATTEAAPQPTDAPPETPVETETEPAPEPVTQAEPEPEPEPVAKVEPEPEPEPAAKVEPEKPARPEFTESVHYALLREAQPVQTGDQIEVLELFWYRCPHCFRLAPYIAQWKRGKPANAELVELPAILNDNWATEARIYYTLEAVGLAEQLHGAVFNAIHRARRPLNTREQLADWAAENGADRAAVAAAFDSFAVDSKMRFAGLMSRKYGVTGVPAIIVDGKYRTSVSMAGSHERLLEVIDHLVERAAGERAGG